jgi:hypothetical protein
MSKDWTNPKLLIPAGAALLAAISTGVFQLIAHGESGAPVPVPAASAGTASVSITSPVSTISCPGPPGQCQFQVTGQATQGLASDLEIIVAVEPVKPGGGGWFIQWPPGGIGPGGGWSQSPADIGSGKYPAHGGDTLELEAVLVRAGATYRGTTLEALSGSETPIADVHQITGFVTESDPVPLTINKG